MSSSSPKHRDAREKAVIRPGRVVPRSSASRSQGVSTLVQWGLRRSGSRGSSYVRPSQDLHPPKAHTSQDETPMYDDLHELLGTVWPRTGGAARTLASPHLVHETPMLIRTKISKSSERRVYQNLDGGRGESPHGRAEHRYVRRGSQVIIKPPDPANEDDAVGELIQRNKSETDRGRQTLSIEVPDEAIKPAQDDARTPFEGPLSGHRRNPKFSEMRSDTYLLNTTIPQPLPTEDEKLKEIASLKAQLEKETKERKNQELQLAQLLELLDTLDSLSKRLDGVNTCLKSVRKGIRKKPKGFYIAANGHPPATNSADGAPNKPFPSSENAQGDGIRFGERHILPNPPEAPEWGQASQPGEDSSDDEDDDDDDDDDEGLHSGEVTPSVCSEFDTPLSPLSVTAETTEDSTTSNTAPNAQGFAEAVAGNLKKKEGNRVLRAVTGATGTKFSGRMALARSWRGKWGKVRESFDVWRDFQQNSDAVPADSLDLLRTALLRHGCGMEKPKLQRLLNDAGLVAGSHLEYGEYLQIVRQAFAQRKKEHWIRSLKLNEMVDNVIHDCLDMEAVSPEGVFNINEKQAAKVFRELRKRAIQEVGSLTLEAERLILNPSNSMNSTSCNAKFAMNNTVTGNFGDLSKFFDGLDKHIGLPNPRIMKAMEMEHLYCEDSDDYFVTTNYNGTRTKPKVEWDFALNPDPNVVYPGVGDGEDGRKAEPLKRFLEHPYKFRAMLTDAEVLALRLYTGPMFMKYNTILRKQPADMYQELKGNTYTTTIHAIVSGIIKLSKIWTLPEDRKLFRGLGGMLLPQVFWVPDEFGCRGGVELGMLSMTTNREIALQYSGKSDFRPTVFEIDVGQVDRGASVNWLSQYPREEEVVMPPLSNLEVVGAPRMEMVDGVEVMIVPLRVNVNIKSLTMDELIGRRMTLHMQMSRTIRGETAQELREEVQATRTKVSVGIFDRAVYERDVEDILSDFDQVLKDHEERSAEWFNDDEHYRSAIVDIVGMKRLALIKWHLIQEHRKEKMSSMFDTSRAIASEALLLRIRETRCQDFANEGVIYRLRSGYEDFPWEEVIDRKVSEVELPSDMEAEQVILAWKCLEQIKEVLQKVIIQGSAYIKLFGPTLDFSNRRPPLQSRGIAIVTGLFQVNTSVQQLKLNHCIVADDGARTLSNGLVFIPDLQRLELSSADIGTPGMRNLCNTLTKMTNLEVLLLHDNHIGDAGATSLAKGLKGLTQLTQLDVSKNNLKLQGAQELAWCIGKLSKLTGLALEHFNVSDNRIDEDGAIQIAQAVSYLTGLHTLNLNKTFNYTMEVGKHIRDIVPATVKIYGIGEHALAENELLTEHQLARNIRPGNQDERWGGKRDSVGFQRELPWTLDSRRRQSTCMADD